MKYLSTIICLLVGSIILTSSFAYCAPAETDGTEAGVLFLRFVNSARANGMGGCVLNQVDEQSAIYNPGALGIFRLDKIVGLTFPNSTKWLPGLDLDMHIKSWSMSGGFSTKLIAPPERKYHLALSVAYSELKLDYGSISYTDNGGNYIGSYNPTEKADFYTVAIGLEYYARLGIGLTFKKITSALGPPLSVPGFGSGVAKADAKDYGLLLEIPVSAFAGEGSLFDQSGDRLMSMELTTSCALVTTNDGENISYLDVAQSDPLPKTRGLGFSLYTSVKKGPSRIGSVRLSYEIIRDMVNRSEEVIRTGLELGIFDALFLRAGDFEDYENGVDQSTWGIGLDTRGIVSLFMASQPEPESKILAYLVNHASLSFDYAKYNLNGKPLDNTEYIQFKLSF